MLTLDQKSNVRRHLGYPVAGIYRVSPVSGSLGQGAIGYRFFKAFGQLEYRLNNLTPDEEARLTGVYMAGLGLVGFVPSPGDTVTATITPFGGGAQVCQATAVSGDDGLAFIKRLAGVIAQNSSLQAAQIVPLAPYGTGNFAQASAAPLASPMPELGLISQTGTTFTVTTAFSGAMALVTTLAPNRLGPTAVTDATTSPITITYGYLPILDALEAGIAGAAQNLDTIKADVWSGRVDEWQQRRGLYNYWRKLLAEYLAIPLHQEGHSRARAVV